MAKKKVKFDLNPLLSGPSLASRASGGSPYRELMISEIDVDPDQPRRVFDNDSLNDLAASIKEHGVLSPILVRFREGGTYQVVAGERRYRASKIAGLNSIPALILSDEDQDGTLAKQLVENLQREDLTPMERALAIGQLKEAHGWSIREIAKRLGVSKGVVQRALDILSLPDDLQAALIAGASESKVLLLGAIDDRALRKEFLSRISDMTRAQLDKEIKSLKQGDEVYLGGTAAKDEKKPAEQSPEDRRLVSEIQRNLGTKVAIVRKKSNQEQGRLVLEFYSSEELEGIYQRLLG